MILHPDPADLHWQDDRTLIVIVDGTMNPDTVIDRPDVVPPADLVALIGAYCDTCRGWSAQYALNSEGVERRPCPDCIGGKQPVEVAATIADASGHHETRGLIRGVPSDLVPIVRPDFSNPLGGLTTFVRIVGPTAWLNMPDVAPKPLAMPDPARHIGRYALIVEVHDG